MRLRDRVAIVTGGGQGMGRAIAIALAGEGAAVIVADTDLPKAEATVAAIAERGGRATAMDVDVSQHTSIVRMVEQTLARYGRIDILVNNAGVIGHMPLLELTEKEWDRVLEINLKGTFLCSQQAAKAMLASKGGVIINLSSISADLPEPECAHYGVSKAGVTHLTKSFAVALGKHNIRVIAIAPGTIRTPMTDDFLGRPGAEEGRLRSIALDHIGTPEEVADAVVFLASDDARYVTGSTLYVEGGMILLR